MGQIKGQSGISGLGGRLGGKGLMFVQAIFQKLLLEHIGGQE